MPKGHLVPGAQEERREGGVGTTVLPLCTLGQVPWSNEGRFPCWPEGNKLWTISSVRVGLV